MSPRSRWTLEEDETLPHRPSLSRSRIYEILPQRVQQWQQSPCVAEEMGRRQLERIRKEQQTARLRLTLMEKRFHELEAIIANAKQQQVQQHEEVRDPETPAGGPSHAPLLLSDPSVSPSAGERRRWRRHGPADLLCFLQPPRQPQGGAATHGEVLR